MNWVFKFDERVAKDLKKLGPQAQCEIIKYITERLISAEDPRRFGKPLSGNLAGFWRYRVRDYRIICQIIDQEWTILVVAVGHRKNIYD